MSSQMLRLYVGIVFAAACFAQAPSADVLKQVLDKTLMSLKPEGYTERQVLFQEVRPLEKKGAF
jgi:hypothetical protein